MSKRNFLTGLLLGAAAAVVISKFFSSEKGKKVVSNLKEEADKFVDDVKKTMDKTKSEKS